jgi:cytochrome c-type biogenesis protein CcmE
MTRKSYVVAMVIILIIAVIPGIYLLRRFGEGASTPEADADTPAVVDVDTIASRPENFLEGSLGVTGKVVRVDESNTSFTLGCDDECLMMPVTYSGSMPTLGSQIVVYGEVKEAEGGRYVFEGNEVKSQ